MSKTCKLIFAMFLVSFFATVSAQCIPPNASGPPRHWDGERGCYVPQGTPRLGTQANANLIAFQQQQQQVVQQQAVQQQQISQQQLNQVLAQQAIRVPFGQQVPQGYCSWGGRIENLVVSGLIGAVMGNLVGGNRSATQKGAAAGMVVGLFVPCNTPQVIQQVVPQQVVQQGVTVQQSGQQGNCPSNTSWKRLDWEGHPQNGKYLCLPSDEQIRMDKEKARERAA